MTSEFTSFFRRLTGYDPFPYQTRLASGPWPELVDVPTGLGKTAAVTIAWLWKRLQADPQTGRRLVYCLPMRTLVDQTRAAATAWCEAAGATFVDAALAKPCVHVLMGGEVDVEWDTDPVAAKILVGTQDMLLSRALNRGYAANRYRWPVHFGLLNSDVLWVLDETQLMGVGVETSAQLDGLRRKLGTVGPAHTIWMSATLGAEQLATIDHPRPTAGWATLCLDESDADVSRVLQRTRAHKRLCAAHLRLDKHSAKTFCADVAGRVLAAHQQRGGLTLVVVNRVSRAQAVYRAIRDEHADAGTAALIHSRFRPDDRSTHEALLHGDGDRIVVATQAIEAGIDVSARTLFTELAPWPSLVQRFGRCNRYGEIDDAEIHWIDLASGDKDDSLLPYDGRDLDEARSLLDDLGDGADVGPEALARVAYSPPPIVRPVVRRRDVLQLFDTTPDLCGNDIDVSRFVRDGEDTDVHVFWRQPDSDDRAAPARAEVCRVSVAAARDFLSRLSKRRSKITDRERAEKLRAMRWDPLEAEWVRVDVVFAGQVVRLSPEAGGYAPDVGWTGEVAAVTVAPIAQVAPTALEAMGDDPDSSRKRWVLLTKHLRHVEREARTLAAALTPAWIEALATAGRWHDVGKAHAAFQARLIAPVADDPATRAPCSGPWAKSNHTRRHRDPHRPHFRHELASALAWLQHEAALDEQRGLVAYLIAAHHGKVRMSIRSLPTEPGPEEPERLYARGVWDGDELPEVQLPDGTTIGPLTLSLEPMQIGPGSWSQRMLELRDAEDLGPFRLAFLETLVRVADWDASSNEQRGTYDD